MIGALLPLLERKTDRGFLDKAQERMRQWNQLMEARGTRDSVPMKPQVAVRALSQHLADDAIIAADCGTVTTWAARHLVLRERMLFSASGSLATMANGLPYAIAAAVAYPGRQVVAIVGDGGLTMLMGELATIAKYKLPIKILVIKNNSFGEIKWEQLVTEGNPTFGEIRAAATSTSSRWLHACGIERLRLRSRPSGGRRTGRRRRRSRRRGAGAHRGDRRPQRAAHFARPHHDGPGAALREGARPRRDQERYAIIKDVIADRIREVV